jgi:uncharacterized protein (DUF2236 family)
MVWRIHREAALFLAAGRALLLQLAHPWVAAAVADHSAALTNPIARFHRTFAIVYTMVFGSAAQADAAARRLYRRHAAISGLLDAPVGRFAAGSRYRANDVAALSWVFATLADSSITAYEIVSTPLSPAERDCYYREFRRFAGFFGIPQTALPQDWPTFAGYVEQMIASDTIAVGIAARRIADRLLTGARPPLRPPGWYIALTAAMLPEKLRAGFALPYGPGEEHRARRAQAAIAAIYPLLPGVLRHVAPYREACARLAGRAPTPLVRLMNRVWIGHPSLAETSG